MIASRYPMLSVAFSAMLCAQIGPSDSLGSPVLGQDEAAILKLIYSYSYKVDSRDLEGFLSLFAEDAVWQAYTGAAPTPVVSVTTREQMRSLFSQRMNEQIAQGIQSRHYQTNTDLSRLSGDRVQAITMVMVTWRYTSPQPATVVNSTGYCVDEFARHANERRLVKRQPCTD
jgi:3-phenylpropionate/cinnamic acid dioxygenase small subunit